MPVLTPRIIQGLAEASVIFQRDVPKHSIVEAFFVSKFSHSHSPFFPLIPYAYQELVFISVFGVGGAIIYAIKKC